MNRQRKNKLSQQLINRLSLIGLTTVIVLGLSACNQDETLSLNKELSSQVNTSEIPAQVAHIKCEITGVLHKYYNCFVYNNDDNHFTKTVQLDITTKQGLFKEETNGEFAEPGQAGFEFNLVKNKDNKNNPVEIYTHVNNQDMAQNAQLHYLQQMLHDVLSSESQS